MNSESKPVFPLSQSQRNIWNLERAYPGTSINHISTTISVRGKMELPLLQESIRLVLQADETLRTRITLRDGEPVQYCVPYMEETYEVYDFSHTDREGIASWEEGMSREPMPVLDAPLYRFALFGAGENSGGVFLKLHHIISDGWSQLLLCNRIAQTYLKLVEGEEPEKMDIPSYRLHVEEEKKYYGGPAFKKDQEYWRQKVQEGGEPAMLREVKSAAVSPVGRRMSFRLPQVLNHAIYLYCLKNRVAPFAVFYMALAIYFRRAGGSAHFTIGVPVVNRTSFVFKQCTGMFVNTLPFFNEIQDQWTLDEFNGELMEAWYELLRHQRFPFEEIDSLARSLGREEGRLFHIALSYQDSKVYESRETSVIFSGRWHYSGYQAEQLCIHLSNMESHREYCVDYDYLTQFFTQEEIGRLHENLVNILMEALHNPQTPLCRLAVIGRTERERVLYTFNRTGKNHPEESLYGMFQRQVKEHGSRVAAIYRGERLTYRELAGLAEAVSAAVRGKMPESGPEGRLAAVLLPRSFELLASLLGVLHAGAAYLILSGELPLRRLLHILKQSGASVLLTDKETGSRLAEAGAALPMLDVFTLRGGLTEEPVRAEEKDGELAYVVYTSGSTGEPKGVQITRGNLKNLVWSMAPYYGKGAVLSVCNVGFDAFTLESVCALLNGATIVLPEDADQESPGRLAELVEGYAAGFLSITPSRLMALLKNAAFARAMRGMETIICGGEQFPAELLKQLKGCTNASVYNQYGPSETTVAVSMKRLNGASVITVGKPMDNCRLYVLDAWKNPLPVGVYGQLYVGGACVGAGYRDPAADGENQLPSGPFAENPFEAGEKIYATGDVGAWTEDGEIVLAGRMDQQVKLRGLRIEPQEAAACIASFPGVREAAARVCELNGQQLLVAYYCAEREIGEMELLSYAASYLPKYMIPSAVVRLETLPLTDRGKVDTARLPLPETAGGRAGEEAGKLAEQITELFAEVLGQPEVNADSDYFLLGGNSLNAMELLSRIGELTGIQLRVSQLYACRSARRLAAWLEKDGGMDEKGRQDRDGNGKKSLKEEPSWMEKIPFAPELERYPLTPIQQGIYVQSCMDPEGMSYHMPGAFRLEAGVDAKRLERAFCRLIASDTIFRTAFSQDRDGVYAHIRKEVPFTLHFLQADSLEEAAASIIKPFRLYEAPLLRAGLWQEPDGRQVLLLDVHHIIGDGLSTPVMMKRLEKYYQEDGENLTEGRFLCYHDYACARMAEKAQKGGLAGKRDRAYWKEHLTPVPESLALPADRPRRKDFDFKGSSLSHRIGAETARQCEEWCRQNGISLYMLFLGAYGILLSAVSGKEEILVGTPVAGRTHRQLQDICGPFISTMPARLVIRKKETTGDYLRRVRDEVNGMLEHPDCSLEEMISMLELPRTFSGNPLYQAAFSMRPFEAAELTLAGGRAEYIPLFTGTAKTELFVELAAAGEGYELMFEYASSLFEEETIRLYARSMENIVRELTGQTFACRDSAVQEAAGQEAAGQEETCAEETCRKEICLGELSLLDEEDRMELLEMPNYRYVPYLNQPIHQMIRNRARRYPDQTAVFYGEERVTRRQLEQRALAVSFALHQNGAARGERIGLSLGRTPLLFAGMLGILKAGCAYVPLSPSLPVRRVEYICRTAGVSRIICDEEGRQAMEAVPGCVLLSMDSMKEGAWEEPGVSGEDLIHVLFTSGSTGKPKGVALTHRSLCNLYANMQELMRDVQGAVLCTANMMFDIFIVESLFPLAMGKPVALADEEEMRLPWKLAEVIERTGAQFLQMTASRLQLCLGNDAFRREAAKLRLVISGGEALSARLAEEFFSLCPGRLLNMYGPTESAVAVTAEQVEPGRQITIGRPLNNCRVYILDEERRPVMPTCVGEIYLAGEGVAEGYVGREDLTREAFFPDLYFPDRKMYKSGDLGRLRADGRIEFWGRRDDQVKVNGQRVELEEIRSLMLESGLAERAAVTALKKPDGAVELAAFYEKGRTENGDGGEEMREWLRDRLPGYMVPSRCCCVEKLPMNANGKVDVQALKAELPDAESGRTKETERPVQAERTEETERPAQASPHIFQKRQILSEEEIERKLLDIWGEILGHTDLSPEISFFRQGGTSLGALSVLSRCYNEGLEMTMARFYENPTARGQARLLAGKLRAEGMEEEGKTERLTEESKPEESKTEEEKASLPTELPGSPVIRPPAAQAFASQTFTAQTFATNRTAEPDEKYPSEVPAARPVPARREGRRVLVTGATGFFGAHLLRELLKTETLPVLCLVRGGNGNRLRETLSWYFGEGWAAAAAGRIRIVEGDLSRPGLGMDEKTLESLAEQVDVIYHCAADVRHYAADEQAFLNVNVGGTEQMIRLARRAGAALMYISTASVGGGYLVNTPDRNAVFTERDLDIGQNWRENLYVRSKFLAEAGVCRAMEDGLCARIFRLGRVTGRASDQVFQKNPGTNAAHMLMRAIRYLGAIPESIRLLPVDMTPVDWCAAAVSALRDTDLSAVHLIHPRPPVLLEAAKAVVPDLRMTGDEEYAALLQEKLAQEKGGRGADILAPLLDYLGRQKPGEGRITIDCRRTWERLNRLGPEYEMPSMQILMRTLTGTPFD